MCLIFTTAKVFKNKETDFEINVMRSVVLIRHTKSDWTNAVDDFDRPIREDRKEDARLIAREIARRGFRPDYIVSSPARRTLQTAKLICQEWDYKYADLIQDKTLYESTPYEIIQHLRGLDDKIQNAVVICHNPSITYFLNRYGDTYIDNVPTTGAALIRFDKGHWADIGERGKMEWFLRPKDLRKQQQ